MSARSKPAGFFFFLIHSGIPTNIPPSTLMEVQGILMQSYFDL